MLLELRDALADTAGQPVRLSELSRRVGADAEVVRPLLTHALARGWVSDGAVVFDLEPCLGDGDTSRSAAGGPSGSAPHGAADGPSGGAPGDGAGGPSGGAAGGRASAAARRSSTTCADAPFPACRSCPLAAVTKKAAP